MVGALNEKDGSVPPVSDEAAAVNDGWLKYVPWVVAEAAVIVKLVLAPGALAVNAIWLEPGATLAFTGDLESPLNARTRELATVAGVLPSP